PPLDYFTARSVRRCSRDHLALPSFPTRRLFRSVVSAALDKFGIDHFTASQVSAFRPVTEQVRASALRIQPSSSTSDNLRPSVYRDRKSTRLNSSHVKISYAVVCLKNKRQDDGED